MSRAKTETRPSWDIWLTLSTLAASIVFAPVAFVAAVWASFSFDACTGQCNQALGDWAFRLAAWGPSLVVVALVVVLILRRRQGKTGWQIGVGAIVVQALLLALSYILTTVALGS
ncbi:MAG: hypothetical protein ABW040_07455 [Microbacteriaceae bacterium]